MYKAGERAGDNSGRDRWHHTHRLAAAAHLEAARDDTRPTRVRSLREGTR